MKYKFEINSEKGIAIIFALGLVSLLFVLALGFFTSSIIQKEIGNNNNNLTSTRLLAESGLQRAIASMKLNSINAEKDFSNVYTHEGDGSKVYYEDLSELLPTTMNNITYYSWPSDYDSSNNNSVTWQYIKDETNNNRLLYRFAYVTLPTKVKPTNYKLFGEKIDLSASVDTGLNAEANHIYAVSENFPTTEATSIDGNGNPVIGRPGRDISELFLSTLSFIDKTDTAEKLSVTNAYPKGLLQYGQRWESLSAMCDSFNENETPIGNKTPFSENCIFDGIPTPEAFTYEDSYDVRTNNGLYHRFNLTRNDWEHLSVNDMVDTENCLKEYSESDSGNIEKCIPWIANWKAAGDYNSADICKKQISANIIDYNDSNTIATTDNADSPSYVGLEKCPYINELNLEFTGSVSLQAASDDGYSIFSGGTLHIVGYPGTLHLSSGHANGSLEIGGLYGGYVEASGIFSSPTTAYTYNSSVTTEVLETQSTPAMPQSLSWYKSQASSNSTSFTVDITVSNKSPDEIRISGTDIGNGKSDNKDVPEGCVIYTTGNITIDGDLSRTVTLVAEGNVSIDPNLTVSLTPAVEDTLIYAGGRVDIDYCDFEASGIIKADAEIEILNSTLYLTDAYLWSKGSSTIKMCEGTISGGGGSSGDSSEYVCNVHLKKAQLEVVDMYSTILPNFTTDPLDSSNSVNCLAEITIEGSYNWNVDDTDSEVNFSKTFNIGINAGSKAYSYNSNSDLINLDISPSSTIINNEDIKSSIEDFQITNLKVKLTDADSNLLDFSFIEPSTVYTATENEDEDESSGVTVNGDLNINSGSNNSSHPFIMQTSGGQIDVDDLKAWSSSDTFEGTASEIKIKAKNNGEEGNSLTINGETVSLNSGTYYTFTGIMSVSIENRTHGNGKALGNWWIDISGSNISIDPGFTDTTVTETEEEGGLPTLSSDGTFSTLYFNYQVADPRQNLNPEDWAGVYEFKNITNSETETETAVGTIGLINTKFSPNRGNYTDSDLEPYATEPWELSTAFIRNDSMLSPWELGFIHRGKAWQTMNLKKYNSSEGYNGGGNSYEDGDANILDQIKMTKNTQTYGKLNINSGINEVLKTLFAQIRVGSNIASTEGPGALKTYDGSQTSYITDNEAKTFADSLIAINGNGTDSSKQFYTRAEILKNNNISNWFTSFGNTDALKEEVIGKYINLSTALRQLPDEFNVIVVAQTIKDLGGTINNKECQTGRYDVGGDLILATQKILATVRRNPVNDKFYITDLEYVD